jgi:hypothetical protein
MIQGVRQWSVHFRSAVEPLLKTLRREIKEAGLTPAEAERMWADYWNKQYGHKSGNFPLRLYPDS